MKRIVLILLPFFAVILLSPVIAWVGGFNFDQRSPEVAVWVFFTIVAGAMASTLHLS